LVEGKIEAAKGSKGATARAHQSAIRDDPRRRSAAVTDRSPATGHARRAPRDWSWRSGPNRLRKICVCGMFSGDVLQFVGEEKEFEHVTGSFPWYFSVYLLLSHFQGQPFFWGVELNDHQI